MDFNEYQREVLSSVIYPKSEGLVYCTLGLTGESGEVADKLKKVLRDQGGVLDSLSREGLAMELGDVLWYVANLSTELGFTFEYIAQLNLNKVHSRKSRGVIQGSGDDR
jgi:NTP pyrophosphatase (non-canonical NTP hydrolase)